MVLSPQSVSLSIVTRDQARLEHHLAMGGDPNAVAVWPGKAPYQAALWYKGDQLLHAAIFVGWVEGVRRLLAAGALPNAVDEGNPVARTPLGRALEVRGPWQSMHPLMSLDTPSSWAATRTARLACLATLLDAGANPLSVDGQTLTPARISLSTTYQACQNKLFDAWVMLGEHGAPLMGLEGSGVLVEQTIREGRMRWVQHWLNRGVAADTIVAKNQGFTGLHQACRSVHANAPAMVKFLVGHADVNRSTSTGDRPLHLALANVRHGGTMMAALLNAGADPTLAGAGGVSLDERCNVLLKANPQHANARAFQHHRWAMLADAAHLAAGYDDILPGARPTPRRRL